MENNTNSESGNQQISFLYLQELVRDCGGVENVDKKLLDDLGFELYRENGVSGIRKKSSEKRNIEKPSRAFDSFRVELPKEDIISKKYVTISKRKLEIFNNLSNRINDPINRWNKPDVLKNKLFKDEIYFFLGSKESDNLFKFIESSTKEKQPNFVDGIMGKILLQSLDFFYNDVFLSDIFEESYSVILDEIMLEIGRDSISEDELARLTLKYDEFIMPRDFVNTLIKKIKINKERLKKNQQTTLQRDFLGCLFEYISINVLDKSDPDVDEEDFIETLENYIKDNSADLFELSRQNNTNDDKLVAERIDQIKEHFRFLQQEYGLTNIAQVLMYHLAKKIKRELNINDDNIINDDYFCDCKTLLDIQGKIQALQQLLTKSKLVEIKKAKRQRNQSRDHQEHERLGSIIDDNRREIHRINEIIEVNSFFTRIPTVITNKLDNYYDEMLKLIGLQKEKSEIYTFISDMDEKLDSNPGVISGDCTEGLPLNFSSNSDLYNVKVFNSTNKHVGNIYLVLIKDKKGTTIGWHLDAIQIPENLKWSIAAKRIRNSLIKEAKKQNIKTISINKDLPFISNYEPVAKAFSRIAQPYNYQDSRLLSNLILSAKGAKSDMFEDEGYSGIQHDPNHLLRLY